MSAGAGAGARGGAIELVVARFRESVDWTRNVPAAVRVTIYDKGGDLAAGSVPHAEVRRLPNVGREAHTALHHLMEQWETLAPLTVFCQGRPFDHAWDFHHTLRALAAGAERVDGFRWLGHLVDTDDAEGRRLFVRWSKNADGRGLALDALHTALMGAPAPPLVRFFGGGQFAVTAELARRRSAEFWERARGLAASFPDAAHCFERIWDRVFGVDGVPAALRGDGPVWLKPVRRAQGRA
jgi:hypothetical protein